MARRGDSSRSRSSRSSPHPLLLHAGPAGPAEQSEQRAEMEGRNSELLLLSAYIG
jgi:hypothetical protein